jgi:ubiquinone/menaquinone biosynthesis C-methylase UbiE
MGKIADKSYLLSSQYKDTEKYRVRLEFHTRFSTSERKWFEWVFEQLHLSPSCRILELGCGLGNLWRDNLTRIPGNWEVLLSDISFRMVEYSKASLEQFARFNFLVADAQAIPFPDHSFDAVIANHLLYHISERRRAFAEFIRVLRPNGRFYASTVGESHLQELSALINRFDPTLNFFWSDSLRDSFTLENGYTEISQWFQTVNLFRYKDTLLVTEVEPIVQFVVASSTFDVGEEKRQQFANFLSNELQMHRAIYITRELGVFEAIHCKD